VAGKYGERQLKGIAGLKRARKTRFEALSPFIYNIDQGINTYG
jgi:hypothetical protein